VFDVTLTTNFQCLSQWVDTDNICRWDQRKMYKLPIKYFKGILSIYAYVV
jgi:hypothetical protein